MAQIFISGKREEQVLLEALRQYIARCENALDTLVAVRIFSRALECFDLQGNKKQPKT